MLRRTQRSRVTSFKEQTKQEELGGGGAQKLRREQSASEKCIHFALYCRVDLGRPDDDGRGGKKATGGRFHKGGHRTPCIIES